MPYVIQSLGYATTSYSPQTHERLDLNEKVSFPGAAEEGEVVGR